MTMTIKATNHYLNGRDFLNVLQLNGRNYIEFDGIRLVFEDGELHGWYNPNEQDCSARNCPEPEETTPSEVNPA